jgi:hypothetical protein
MGGAEPTSIFRDTRPRAQKLSLTSEMGTGRSRNPAPVAVLGGVLLDLQAADFNLELMGRCLALFRRHRPLIV